MKLNKAIVRLSSGKHGRYPAIVIYDRSLNWISTVRHGGGYPIKCRLLDLAFDPLWIYGRA